MSKKIRDKQRIAEVLRMNFFEREFSKDEIYDFCAKNSFTRPGWFINDTDNCEVIRKNIFKIVSDNKTVRPANKVPVAESVKEQVKEISQDCLIANFNGFSESYIPKKCKSYVKYGYYSDILKIIESRLFYPVFITGLSGNGKTSAIEQACSETKRELIRVNITAETDEDDLLGGFRLVDGSTKWFDGPITIAMKRGALLLLDEVDLASVKIMCLQPVLEGKPLFLKKISTLVEPKAGFNIVATANTKGQGCLTGKFIGTSILNEAFLDRFPVTLEQSYPDRRVESKILTKNFEQLGVEITDKISTFVESLCAWAEASRYAFDEGQNSEVISTRRLIHIIQAYVILNDKKKSIEYCIARFNDDSKAELLSAYEKFDYEINPELVNAMQGDSNLVEGEQQNVDNNIDVANAPF